MKRALSLLLFAVFIGAAISSATAEQYAPRIEGKKARKQQRYMLYKKNLRGEKRQIYREYGYTPNRLRVDHGGGEITETWTYHALGLELVFDGDSRLIEQRKIVVEDRGVAYF